MDRYIVICAIAAFLPLATGCATADELDPREAAYPDPIGVTLPHETPQQVPPPRAGAPAGVARVSANAEADGPDAVPVDSAAPSTDPAVSGSAPPTDIVVGDDGESDESVPAAAGEVPPGQPPEGPPPGLAPAPSGYGDADPSALTDFRSSLDPYGAWTDDPNYGTVWVPSPDVVGDDFTPYASAGHWAYDDDYTWVSDYDWGWVPFHYGRWVYGQGFGWEWIPGRRYAGAWVSWRYGEPGYGVVGWAPLAPTWGWRDGVAVELRNVPRSPYAYVSTRDLFSGSVGQHIVSGPPSATIAPHTRSWVAPSLELRRSGARGTPSGPPPALLRIAASSIVHTTPSDRGILQARAFARPNTAAALGGRAPRGAASARQYRAAFFPSTTLRGTGVGGREDYASHFGGRFGVGFVGNPYAAGPMRAPAGPQGRPYVGGSPAYGGGYRGYGAPVRGPTSGAVFRSPPAGSGMSGRAPSAGPASFHSGGGYGGSHGGGGRSGGGRGGGRR